MLLGFVPTSPVARSLTRTLIKCTPLNISSTCSASRRSNNKSRALIIHSCSTSSSGSQVTNNEEMEEISKSGLVILKYPHPLLRRANESIVMEELDQVASEALKKTARQMLSVMYESHGVGLAAPQVGINKRLLVFNAEGDSKAFLQEVVMINPQIMASSKKTVVDTEACLSFPLMSGQVERFEWVKVEGYRLNGKKFKVKYEGWKARIFQHEFDHLQGILYVDHLHNEDRLNCSQTLQNLISEYQRNPYEGLSPSL